MLNNTYNYVLDTRAKSAGKPSHSAKSYDWIPYYIRKRKFHLNTDIHIYIALDIY